MQKFNLKNKKERIKAKTIKSAIFSAFLLSFIFLISFSSASIQVGLDGSLNEIGINFDRTPFNISEQSVNESDYWNTLDRGPLRNIADIQHSWLSGLLWSAAGHVMDTVLDMNNNNIIDINNLEVNNNISIGNYAYIGGDTFIETGRLFVGPLANTSTAAVNPGDSVFRGNMIISDSTLSVIPDKYSPSAMFFNHGADDPGSTDFYLNFSGGLNISTELFCDYLNNPFKANDTLNIVISVYSAEFSTDNIYLPINSVINSSCIIVETRIFGDGNVTELTTVAYVITPQPVFGIFDNGLVVNGIRMYYETNSSSDQFGSYTRENTVQKRPGANLFADAFTGEDGNLEYASGSQTGLNNSGGFWRNSFGVWSTRGYTSQEKTNLSILHDMFLRWEKINITPRLPYDSQTGGADLAVEHGIETQIIHIHDELSNGLLQVIGDLNVILRNNFIGYNEEDLDIIGPIHVRQPIIETIGVDAGEQLTRLLATFEQGTLFPFILITEGKGSDEWNTVSDINCPPNGDFCSHAGPTGGSGNTIMQTNITTNVTQDMNLSFKINTDGMTFGGILNVTINNNEGNIESIYSLVETDVSDLSISIIIPQVYENKSLVTVEFIFSSTHPLNGDVWIDTINVTGTANESTINNITRLHSLIKLGGGEIISPNELPTNGIFYNDSNSFTKILGDFTVESMGIGTESITRNLNIKDTMNIQPRVSAPSNAAIGDIYVDSSSNELCFYDGVSWTGLKAGGVCV